MFRPLALAMLTALSLLVAVSCGGSDSPLSTATEPVVASTNQPLSKSELIAQGDAICKASREQVAPLLSELKQAQRSPNNSADRSKVADLFRQGRSETEEEVSQLRSLVPPLPDRAVIDSWLSKLEVVVHRISGIADAVERDDRSEAGSLNHQAETESEAAHKIARGYGFKICDTKG